MSSLRMRIVEVSLVICLVLGICLLTNPRSKQPEMSGEDVEDALISAVCVESLLVDFDASEKTKDVGLTFENGNAMYWSPLDKDGKAVDRAVIHRKVKYILHHWSAPVCIYKIVRKVV